MKRTTEPILLVDDSTEDVEFTLAAMAEFCRPGEVQVAHDGMEALDYLLCRGRFSGRASGNPVLILLDIKMPLVDGLEVLRTVKNDEHLKTIPVVMLTSSREPQDIDSSYRLGSNAYVVKPLVFGEFRAAMHTLSAFWVGLNESSAVSV